MARRGHKKSRNGCIGCKRRHIKCDEAKPTCTYCSVAGSSCVYNQLLPKDSPSAITAEERPAPRSRSAHSSSIPIGAARKSQAYGAGLLSTDADAVNLFEINMLHMELISHFLTETCKTLFADHQSTDVYRRSVVASAMEHPFLMYETLALAAIHLSVIKPDKQQEYRRTSTAYQTKALSKLDGVVHRIDADNCLAVLLFSNQIGTHSFIETFDTSSKISFSSFLDKLIHSITLMRGINAILAPWRAEILKTDFSSILHETSNQNAEHIPGDETAALRALIEQAELVTEQRNTYKESVEKLQWHFNGIHAMSEAQHAASSTVFAWLITASPHFVELLREHRPESLVLLAYYAVILHKRRNSWVIGDAGKYLLESTMCHLGRHWDPWLEWPKSQIFAQ